MQINTIYCEDCNDTMKRMADNSIDLTVTSPPYDMIRKYEGYTFNFPKTAIELFRVTKQGGVVVWIINDTTINGARSMSSFKQALFFTAKCGFNMHDVMIWQKPNYAPLYPSVKRYDQNFDYMFILSKCTPKTWNPIKDKLKSEATKSRGKYKTRFINPDGTFQHVDSTNNDSDYSKRNCVWVIPPGTIRGLNHPATFPEQLIKDHIITWSNENDLIYDPFMGSGTTAKCCKIFGRNYIGSEISQKYCDIANKRLGESDD
jgi:DNA modification methylase